MSQIRKAGRPVKGEKRKAICLRLPEDIYEYLRSSPEGIRQKVIKLVEEDRRAS
jgi:hypothetical protein